MRGKRQSYRRKIRFEALESRNMLAYLAGDFNLSGVVDNGDYNEWRANFGSTGPEILADGNSDGTVDGADYVLWRNNLGKTLADVAPDAPTNVEARAVGATSVEVTWQAAAHTTSYAVQRRAVGIETEFTTIAPSVTTTIYTDSTAASNTLYEYRVVAQNANGSSPGSQGAETTPNQSGLTAYRPQGVHHEENPTGPVYDAPLAPHTKTRVSEDDENSNTEGPGIRINADDDNQNGTTDRVDAQNGTAVAKENELIEVKIDRLPGQGNLVLSAGSRLRMYYHHDLTAPIESGEPLNFVNNQSRVFVEWVDSNHGTDSLSLVDQATQTTLDSLQFQSFRSMVVIFGGNTQNPRDIDKDGKLGDPVKGGPNREGIFDFASELYVTGWDVYAYDEEVDLNIPFTEVINAVDRRFVFPDLEFFQGGGVAIMGYSQGAGAAHDLTEMLTTHYDEQQQNFVAMLTVYIDAIERQIFPLNDPIQETDYPNNTLHLLNIFQRNDPTFLGDYVDEDDPNIPFGVTIEQIPTHETAGWNNSLTHEQIDDNLQVKQRMRLRLDQLLIRR